MKYLAHKICIKENLANIQVFTIQFKKSNSTNSIEVLCEDSSSSVSSCPLSPWSFYLDFYVSIPRGMFAYWNYSNSIRWGWKKNHFVELCVRLNQTTLKNSSKKWEMDLNVWSKFSTALWLMESIWRFNIPIFSWRVIFHACFWLSVEGARVETGWESRRYWVRLWEILSPPLSSLWVFLIFLLCTQTFSKTGPSIGPSALPNNYVFTHMYFIYWVLYYI